MLLVIVGFSWTLAKGFLRRGEKSGFSRGGGGGVVNYFIVRGFLVLRWFRFGDSVDFDDLVFKFRVSE